MNNRRQEIVGILLIALGVLIILSLVSYNSVEEPTISRNIAIQNWMGIVGIYISHYLIKYTIGVTVLILPILML
ncbi:MAG: DNA translocase FtsK 4TM domain-containing protein, partial [Candidatus Neomarinimicrobiota bacterium]